MPRTLFEDEAATPVTPLLDVVLNGLGAIFVMLMVYMLLVQPSEPLRLLDGVDPPPAIRGQSYAFTFPVVGGTGGGMFSLAGALPQGLLFDSTSGTLYGTPAVDADDERQPVRYDVEVTVEDGRHRDERKTVLTLHPATVPYPGPLTMVGAARALRAGRVGVRYEDVIGATGGVQPYGWGVVAGVFPPGLRLRDGRIWGVPERAGRFAFTVGVTYSSGTFEHGGVPNTWEGGRQEGRYDVEILRPLRSALHLPEGRVGEAYVGGVIADALLPGERVRWTGDVPGVASQSGGWLEGRPSRSGRFGVAYTVERDGEEVGRGEGRLRVLPRRPVRGAGSALFYARSGEPVDFAIPYAGLREPVTVTSQGDLPEGLRVDDGRLRGTPVRPGLHAIPVRVEDAVGTVVTGEVAVRTGPARSPLHLQVPRSVHALISQPFYFAPTASGGEGAYRWSLGGRRPAGLTFHEDGSLRGVVERSGRWPLTVSLEDVFTGERLSRPVLLVATWADSTVPTVLTREAPVALVGERYHLELAAAGGVGAYTWSLTPREALPAGLALTSSGVVGTPTEQGAAVIEVTVTDAAGQTDGPHLLRLVSSDPAEVPLQRLARATEQIDALHTRVTELEERGAELEAESRASEGVGPGRTSTGWTSALGGLRGALVVIVALVVGVVLGYYLWRRLDGRERSGRPR